jgi:hypothetical protein
VAGLLGVALPSQVIPVVNILPGIQIVQTDNSNVSGLLRMVGTGYAVAGSLLAWHVITGRPNEPWTVVVVVFAGVAGLFVARLLWLPESDASVFVSILGLLWPLTVGSLDSRRHRVVAGMSAFALIGVGTVLNGPASNTLTPPWWTVIVATVFSITWGLPLYVVGRQWRRSA